MPTESSIWDVLNEFLVPKFEPTKTWENLKLLGSDPNEWLRQGIEQMSSPKAQAFGALDPMLGMIMPISIVYHVAPKSVIGKIFKRGILPQETPSSYGKAGQDLRELFKVDNKTFGNVHAFEELDDAIRYGANRQWESKNPYSIIRINEEPNLWNLDKNIESQFGYKGNWLSRPYKVPKENLIDSIDITDELIKSIIGKY